MKGISFWLIPLALVLGACVPVDRPLPTGPRVFGSGHLATETRAMANFHDVVLEGVGSLTITVGTTEALSIEAEDNLLPLLGSQVRGTRLVLDQAQPLNPTRPIRYTLSAARLRSLTIAGGADVTVNGLATDAFDVGLQGAGTVRVSGKVGYQSLTISGAGTYLAQDLASREAIVQIDGAGTAIVNASDYLDGTVNGLGTIEYIGSPRVHQSINGLGTVRRRS
jgi:hypothetical protein